MTVFRRLLVLLAGLFGAFGVAAAAAGAHMNPDPLLATAAQFLMLGAPALAGAAAIGAAGGRGWSPADFGGAALALGTALFSGALIARVMWNVTLFPMAAPAGGTILIIGWLVFGLAAFQRARAAV